MMLLEIATTSTEIVQSTSEMTQMVRSYIMPPILAIMGAMAICALFVREYSRFVFLVGTGSLSSLLCYGVGPMLERMGKEESAVPEPAATPLVANTAPAVALPWEFLGFTVLSLAIIVGLVFAGTFGYKKFGTVARDRKANIKGWEKLIARHHELHKEWSSYEMDMVKIIDYPMMNDMREPLIKELHSALRNEHKYLPESAKSVAHIPYLDSDFDKALHKAELAFQVAVTEAKRVAWSKFTESERKNLLRAKDLLALAMDSSASPSERHIAYKRVIKELEGLVSVSARAMLEIQSITKMQLAEL